MAGCRVAGRAVARTLFRLRVVGADHLPRTGPVLLAANHAGFADGPLVSLVTPRPAALLAKAEIFAGAGARVFGWLGLIPVHRGTADRDALTQALAVLTAGGALGVVPEGRRSAGSFEEMTDGIAGRALRSGASTVPVAVVGTARSWPGGWPLPRLRSPVSVAYGEPLTLRVDGDPRARRTVQVAAEQLRVALVEHLATAGAEKRTA